MYINFPFSMEIEWCEWRLCIAIYHFNRLLALIVMKLMWRKEFPKTGGSAAGLP